MDIQAPTTIYDARCTQMHHAVIKSIRWMYNDKSNHVTSSIKRFVRSKQPTITDSMDKKKKKNSNQIKTLRALSPPNAAIPWTQQNSTKRRYILPRAMEWYIKPSAFVRRRRLSLFLCLFHKIGHLGHNNRPETTIYKVEHLPY